MAPNPLNALNWKLQACLAWAGRNERKTALAIVAVGFLIRLVLFTLFRFCWGDCQWYTWQVLKLTQFDFGALWLGLGMGRPLLALSATLVAWLIHPLAGSASAETALQLIALLSGTASIWLVYLLGKKVFDYRVGLFAAFFLAFFQASWYYSVNGLSENPAAFTTLLFLVLFVDALKSGAKKQMMGAGFAFYAGLMVREDIAFLLPLVLYMLWQNKWKNAKPLLASFAAPFLLTLPLLSLPGLMTGMTSSEVPLITWGWYLQPATYGTSLTYILQHFDYLYLCLILLAFGVCLTKWREGGYFLFLWFIPRYWFYLGRNLGSDYGRFFFLSALTLILALGFGFERLWIGLKKNHTVIAVALLLLFAHNNNSLNVTDLKGFVGHYLFTIYQEHGSDQEMQEGFLELTNLKLGEKDMVFEDYSINLVNLYSQTAGLPSLRVRDAGEKAGLLAQYADRGFPSPGDFWKCSETLKGTKEHFDSAVAGRTLYTLERCKRMFGDRIEKFGVGVAYEAVAPQVYRMTLSPTTGSG